MKNIKWKKKSKSKRDNLTSYCTKREYKTPIELTEVLDYVAQSITLV